MVTWSDYRETIGDRADLFAALVDRWGVATALYPGSYVDLSPSTAVPSVTYVDTDRRAARFFADETLVAAELRGRCRPGAGVEVVFHQADYTQPLPLPVAASTSWSRCTPGPSGTTAAATSLPAVCCWPTPATATPASPRSTDTIRQRGRGIAYTTPAFAYVFAATGPT